MTRASNPQCHLFGLAPSGVCLAIDVTINAVVSYTAFSPLPRVRAAVIFCGTVPRVTPGGRYPPLCSAESGLSSAPQHPVLSQRGVPRRLFSLKDTREDRCEVVAISASPSALLVCAAVKSVDIKPRLVEQQPSNAVGCSG